MVMDMLNYACVLCPCHSHIWGVLRALWLYLINLWIPLPCKVFNTRLGFPDDSAVKNPPANVGDIGDVGLVLGLGRSPGGGNCNPLQYSCLEIPWTEEPGGLESMGSQRVRRDSTEHTQEIYYKFELNGTWIFVSRHQRVLSLVLNCLLVFKQCFWWNHKGYFLIL